MKLEEIKKDFDSLPDKAQQEVIDYIKFLKQLYSVRLKANQTKKIAISKEQFIGMWKGHKNITDSIAWVRDIRKSEWNINNE